MFFKQTKRVTKILNTFKAFLKNAVKEVVFLMLGILLALSVNNWKEQQKHRKTEHLIYHDFLTTLQKDSTDLAFIAKTFNKGFAAQQYFIYRTSKEVLQEKTLDEIEALILKTLDVSHSFFPRYGIYQQVLNNGQFALLESEAIKAQLMEVYERRYKLYEHVDATVETKIHFDLQPVVKGKFQLFAADKNQRIPHVFSKNKFKTHYDDFTYQMRSMHSILKSTQKIIGVMQDNIHTTLDLLREKTKATQ